MNNANHCLLALIHCWNFSITELLDYGVRYEELSVTFINVGQEIYSFKAPGPRSYPGFKVGASSVPQQILEVLETIRTGHLVEMEPHTENIRYALRRSFYRILATNRSKGSLPCSLSRLRLSGQTLSPMKLGDLPGLERISRLLNQPLQELQQFPELPEIFL